MIVSVAHVTLFPILEEYSKSTLPVCYRSPTRGSCMYIDPTTGSLVLQILAAGVLSVAAMASNVREGVKSCFKFLSPKRGRWAGKP